MHVFISSVRYHEHIMETKWGTTHTHWLSVEYQSITAGSTAELMQHHRINYYMMLDQAWANYSLWAICGPSGFLIRPAEVEELLNFLSYIFPAILTFSH